MQRSLRLSTHSVSQFLWLGVTCDSSNVKWVDDSFIFIHTQNICKYIRIHTYTCSEVMLLGMIIPPARARLSNKPCAS